MIAKGSVGILITKQYLLTRNEISTQGCLLPLVRLWFSKKCGKWHRWRIHLRSNLSIECVPCNSAVILPLRRPEAERNEKKCDQGCGERFKAGSHQPIKPPGYSRFLRLSVITASPRETVSRPALAITTAKYGRPTAPTSANQR